ncbi:uncharacterized protein C8A04DRAFT_38943 [Dichotomopilus funicola]|uniref:Uncharacterized protein n=1 Tax=Dichotomopilus funicola TaxID=1934379 RepID=A0AAN6UZL4_9PEZI|nr:hypothetical protein C8A04DRAFT_38943 [Dichotomopilus funicola]
MSTTPSSGGQNDQASLITPVTTGTSSPRGSIVDSLRRKTSRFLLRRDTPIVLTATVDNSIAQDVAARPLIKTKRGWFQSVGSRFHSQGRHAALGSSGSSQYLQIEMAESPSSSPPTDPVSTPEISPALTPPKRHRLKGRFQLNTLPARFRRRKVDVFSRSPSLSDEDKENFLDQSAPVRPGYAVNTGSWSSFRFGVHKAVRDLSHSRPSPRPALRTLWTIMSADSSE